MKTGISITMAKISVNIKIRSTVSESNNKLYIPSKQYNIPHKKIDTDPTKHFVVLNPKRIRILTPYEVDKASAKKIRPIKVLLAWSIEE